MMQCVGFFIEFPSSVQDVRFISKTKRSVILLWKSPIQLSDQDVLYDITCNKCPTRNDIDEPCKEPCGPLVAFKPSQNNLTDIYVRIQGLEKNTEYQFIIYSKNQNSLRINRTNWEWNAIKIKTEGMVLSAISDNTHRFVRRLNIGLPCIFNVVYVQRGHRFIPIFNRMLIHLCSTILTPNPSTDIEQIEI